MKNVNIYVVFSGQVNDEVDLTKVILNLDCKNIKVLAIGDEAEKSIGQVNFFGTEDVVLLEDENNTEEA